MKSLDAETDAGTGDAGRPLSEVAYQAVVAMLASGELAPNDVVQERAIAARLGLSRTPLREAFRRLEGERLLERQRTGVLVARALPVDEYMHILDVRRLLEAEATRLAAGHIEAEQLAMLRQRVQQLRALPDGAPVPPESGASDRDLHLLIAVACANPVLQQLIADLRKRMAMFRMSRIDRRRTTVCDEHLAIIDALAAGDGLAAQQAMERHIDSVRAGILARLRAR